jgi:hypothetical protein
MSNANDDCECEREDLNVGNGCECDGLDMKLANTTLAMRKI